MPRKIDALRITSEAGGVSVNPRDRAAHLIGHHHQIAACVLDRHEIRHDVMRARRDEHLGRESIALRRTAAPRAAVDADLDRLPSAGLGPVEVKLFDFAGAIGQAHGRAQPRANQFAANRHALADLLAIGRIGCLVVGRVEFSTWS